MILAVQQPSAEYSVECTAILTVCILPNTAHLPVQWQYTKPSQLSSEMASKSVPASKIKDQCAGNAPNTDLSQ